MEVMHCLIFELEFSSLMRFKHNSAYSIFYLDMPVYVDRAEAIQRIRDTLPAVLTEQEIVDAVLHNDFSIICGDTGCGKSTQVPQFLYEAGFTEGKNAGYLIGVTQPRRVAAVAVAERVGVELNAPQLVGHQVRYDKQNCGPDMRIKFMTDGILLRELQADIRLPRYSVIVVDEAHERSINCDLLLGLLSGAVRARRTFAVPLRVVIMSATLRMTDFVKNRAFFSTPTTPPCVVQISNRMHPVIVHYERTTMDDYISEAVAKVRLIHKTLPQGSILVFVTGKAEVIDIADQLSRNDDDEERVKKIRLPASDETDFNLGQNRPITEELVWDSKSTSGQQSSKKNETELIPFIGGGAGTELRPFPLYAQMDSCSQRAVFSAPTDHCNNRVVVVATNVAETSLTLPNIRYVIDCGREKRKEFNAAGVGRFAVRFCSQAAAAQRAGRAGRVGPGHVYRLFSPNVFGEHMAVHASAEIETNPLDHPVLFLASLGVPSFSHFPWPSPPCKQHVDAAIKRLVSIGALEKNKSTPLGELLVQFPIAPRLAAILVAGATRKDPQLLSVLLAVVAMLSVESIPLPTTPEERKTREIEAKEFDCDMHMCVLKFGRYINRSHSAQVSKALDEAISLFTQLGEKAEAVFGEKKLNSDSLLHAIKNAKKNLWANMRECCLHGFVDQIAIRDEAGSNGYRAPECSDLVFIHSSSVLHKRRPKWLAYSEMMQDVESGKRTMRMCFGVDPEYLATIDSPLVDRSKSHPLLKPTIVGDRKIGWVVPKYTPLSAVLSSATKVDL